MTPDDRPLLPQLEQMLVDAGDRASGSSAATPVCPGATASDAGGRQRRRRWSRGARRDLGAGRRRLILIAMALILTTGTALAATRPWAPLLGNERGGHPSPSTRQVSRDFRGLLGVLRRMQDSRDRAPGVAKALRSIGSQNHGVQIGGVRLLGKTVGGQPVVLIPTERFGDDSAGPSPADISDALCVYYPGVPTGANAAFADYPCWTAAQLRHGQALGRLNSAGIQHIFGLAPDGVRTVTIQLTSGTAFSATAHGNFFDAVAPPGTPRLAAVTAVRWRDTKGRPVGPPLAKP